jgi:GNAT superfamily N-acetyltransferase
MVNAIRSRRYRDSDAPAIHALIHTTIDTSYSGVCPPRAIAFFKRHHSLDEIRRRAMEGCTLVIERDGRIVVTGTVKGDYIGGVFVEPGQQRSGYGGAIMAHLEQRVRDAAFAAVTLDVSLPSRGF